MENNIISFSIFKEAWQEPLIKEGIFLAAPVLYYEIDKYVKNQITDDSKKRKIEASFLKYLTRMSTRCTPFGLFAGCSIGELASNTSIKLCPARKSSRQTSFDMNFLVALAQSLSQESNIKKQLLFYPNSSLYVVGDQLRYIEYSYQNNRRVHSIEAVNYTKYLMKTLHSSKNGKTLYELSEGLVSDTISNLEAAQFIDELVKNQLLISELEPSVSGDDFLAQIINTLERITPNDLIVNKLKSLSQSLLDLDKNMGNSIHQYENISNSLNSLKIPVELKYAFQTDLFTKTKSNKVSKNTLPAIKKGMVLLNKMTLQDTDTNLNQFKNAFIKRYEDREVPLSLALDVEMGIGYLQNNEVADDTPILDDLHLPDRTKPEERMAWNKIDDILQKKMTQTIANNGYFTELVDDDFVGFDENWNDLPNTMATITEILSINDEEVIFFNSTGGAGGANLFARFCNGSSELLQHTQNIIEKDDLQQPDKIHAEIVHLPEARTGNILKRPIFREYEIPYLSKSNLPIESQIGVNDLMISVNENRIKLRSKSYRKEVVPHLTNAHNFRSNSLPIYHFLCDLQNQNLRSSLYFSWGNVAKNQSFLPRVVYNTSDSNSSIIFSKAKWNLSKNDMAAFVKLMDNTNKLLNAITNWRKKLKMPQYVQLVESDNTLVVNLENASSINMLLTTIKNKEEFVLEEFLFDKDGIVKSKNGHFTNQIVFSFYKDK